MTDANVALGYVNPEFLAGGEVPLNAAKARAVIAERVAGPLGLSLEAAAHGAFSVAVSAMIRAIKAVSSERGRDPRDYVLCAFGGNGPIVAAALARALEIGRVIVPPAPGLFSAFGLLYSDVEHHLARAFPRALAAVEPAELEVAYERLGADALDQLRAEGYPPERIAVRRFADLHYRGQSFELTVPVPDGPIALGDLDARFAAEHERTYGHRADAGEPTELVTLRVIASGIPAQPRAPERLSFPAEAAPTARSRRAYFGREHGWRETPVIGRAEVPASALAGPLIVEEYDASTVVPPDATIRRDAAGNLVLELRRA
jgi:N-methylhydantoinase A